MGDAVTCLKVWRSLYPSGVVLRFTDIVMTMETAKQSFDPDIIIGGQPQREAQDSLSKTRLFTVYNGYRLLVSVCLIALLIIPDTRDLVSGFDRTLFLSGCLMLSLSAIGLVGPLGRSLRQSETGVFGLLLLDVTAIALIASASGGILSGFSVLYLITVAAAAVMLATRILATLVAAIGVLAVLFDTLWLVSRGEADIGMMLPAGILGSLIFAVSLLVQGMALRLARAEAQADAAESQVLALQEINQQIILHMDTGVLLISEDRQISPINAAAQRLMNLQPGEQVEISLISPELKNQYEQWRLGARQTPQPFRLQTDAPALIANFAPLDDRIARQNLAFIEDYTPVTQFAQSLKLNSLSKLTASIAHEIRNPLAAISHAAQLLSESQTIDPADEVLCDIIVSNTDRVSRIIENVTDVSRRQAPRPELLDLNHWVDAFIEEYRKQRTKSVAIALHPTNKSLSVSFDPQHLKRVLNNLLDNALRHSFEDANRYEARIDISTDPGGGQVFLDVVDYGLGVAERDVARLFEPFFTTSKDGCGLGLYLCKELCEINGAGLVFQPTTANESAFRVSIQQEAS